MNLKVLKPYLPHAYVVLGFFLIVCVYFLPLYQGKNLRQSDILQYQGMAKEIQDNRAKYGEEPFWTNAMFGGMPNTMISMEYSGNLIKPIHILTTKLIAYPASLIFISMFCFYLLMLAFDVSLFMAAIGAIGFGLSSFNIIGIEVGHNAKLACMSYMPLVLAGLVYGYRKHIWIGAAMLALGIALQVVNNHIQITYYLAFIVLAYLVTVVLEVLQTKAWADFVKKSLILLVASTIGLATHMGYFMSIQEYGTYSIRGKTELTPLEANKEAVRADGLDRDYVFNYSNALDEPLTYLIPNYLGGASSGPLDRNSETAKAMRENGVDPQSAAQFMNNVPLYFGQQPYVAGPFYLGAIILFLFVLSLIVVNEPIKWALLACSIFGIMLTFGKNLPAFNYLLFDHFPLFNKFRSVTMAVVIPQFCMAMLAGLALKRWFELPDKTIQMRKLLIASGITGGVCLLVWLLAGSTNYSTEADTLYRLPDWLVSALQDDRKGLRTGDALRSFGFIIAAVAILYLIVQGRIKQNIGVAILALLTLIDLWMVDKRYLNNDNFDRKVVQSYYTPSEADQYILADTDPNYRVFNLQDPFNDARTSYFHKSVGGYSPAKLRRYQDLIERVLSVEQKRLMEGLQTGNFNLQTYPVLNMLNTRYIIAGDKAEAVLKNPYALGNAWFISQLQKVHGPDAEIAKVPNLNTRTEAVIDVDAFQIQQDNYVLDTTASVQLTAFKPYELTYETNNTNPGFVVFSEVYYPKGWTLTIDEIPTPLVRVNYVLRGAEVPAGKHKLKMVMQNTTYQTGNMVSLISSVLVFALIGFAIIGVTRNQK